MLRPNLKGITTKVFCTKGFAQAMNAGAKMFDHKNPSAILSFSNE